MDLLDYFVNCWFVCLIKQKKKRDEWYISFFFVFLLAARVNAGEFSCSPSSCENGATCQKRGLNSVCICKPGFTGQRCESGMFTCVTYDIGTYCLFFRIFSLSS